jgi:hypothetical protein
MTKNGRLRPIEIDGFPIVTTKQVKTNAPYAVLACIMTKHQTNPKPKKYIFKAGLFDNKKPIL